MMGQQASRTNTGPGSGANGSLLKYEDANAISEAIPAILVVRTWLSQSVSGHLISIVRGEKNAHSGRNLTAREKEVLKLLGREVQIKRSPQFCTPLKKRSSST
jgi:DNA-binding NarL/FixJ family response regulator